MFWLLHEKRENNREENTPKCYLTNYYIPIHTAKLCFSFLNNWTKNKKRISLPKSEN